MSVHMEQDQTTGQKRDRGAVLVCLAGAALATVVVPLMGGLSGDTGAEVTDQLVAGAGRIQVVALIATLSSATLLLASVRLGRAIGGVTGGLATAAGTGVSLLLAAYYSAFAAGAVVSTVLISSPSPAIGESTLLMINLTELTRYAPGTALLAAAVLARRVLPKPLTIVAVVLLVLTFVPFTTWLVAIVVPIWLGVAGAVVGPWRLDGLDHRVPTAGA